MLGPQCSVCKSEIKSEEFMAVIGNRRESIITLFSVGRGYPYINPLYIYCNVLSQNYFPTISFLCA